MKANIDEIEDEEPDDELAAMPDPLPPIYRFVRFRRIDPLGVEEVAAVAQTNLPPAS